MVLGCCHTSWVWDGDWVWFDQVTMSMSLCFAFWWLCLSPTATSPRVSSELEQARPQTSGEEELQLQLALAMSREVAEQVGARQVWLLAGWLGPGGARWGMGHREDGDRRRPYPLFQDVTLHCCNCVCATHCPQSGRGSYTVPFGKAFCCQKMN